jgi:hypothetical protein
MTARSKGYPLERASSRWLRALRIYLGHIVVGNLIWESLQLPLYTIWNTGTAGEQMFAVVHCLLGDLLIALGALTLALLIAGDESWPAGRFWQVAGFALVFGIAYTVFSEWRNVTLHSAWAYSDWMPVLSVFGLKIGLSPRCSGPSFPPWLSRSPGD